MATITDRKEILDVCVCKVLPGPVQLKKKKKKKKKGGKKLLKHEVSRHIKLDKISKHNSKGGTNYSETNEGQECTRQ